MEKWQKEMVVKKLNLNELVNNSIFSTLVILIRHSLTGSNNKAHALSYVILCNLKYDL